MLKTKRHSCVPQPPATRLLSRIPDWQTGGVAESRSSYGRQALKLCRRWYLLSSALPSHRTLLTQSFLIVGNTHGQMKLKSSIAPSHWINKSLEVRTVAYTAVKHKSGGSRTGCNICIMRTSVSGFPGESPGQQPPPVAANCRRSIFILQTPPHTYTASSHPVCCLGFGEQSLRTGNELVCTSSRF